MSPREEAVLADRAEACAYADLFDAAPAASKSLLGLRVERFAGATALVAPRLPTTMFNRVIGLGLDEPVTPAHIERLRVLYRDAGSAAWWLHWSPFATFAGGGDGDQRLAALGFTLPARRSWAKMLRPTAEPRGIATDLGIAPVADAQVAEVAASVATSFGMPPFMGAWIAALHGRPRWRVYAVTEGARVVGGGCLFAGPDAGWLGMGAVLPSHRRRGGQGALMARRIADAGAAGLAWVVTETGEAIGDEPNPSLANMVRSGFRRVASRLNFECAPGPA